jgi:hypothetical protein
MLLIRKSSKVQFLLLAFFSLFVNAQAQDACKVLQAGIDSIYIGKCKKGLAHGDGLAIGTDRYEGRFKQGYANGTGTYTWSTGETYIGDFVDGLRDGEGVYIFTINGQDATSEGLWKDDVYVGEKPKKPTVRQSVSIDRHTFRKNAGSKNRVLIDFFQNGDRNKGLSNVMLTTTSRYPADLGQSRGYDEVAFPVTITVKYETFNKLHTSIIHCIFDFTIYEPGDWRVELTN